MVHRPKPPKSSKSPLAVPSDMDRKVYIPLCFCLVSFAVMIYVN